MWNHACDFMADEIPDGAPEGDRHLVEALGIDGSIQANEVVQACEVHDVETRLSAALEQKLSRTPGAFLPL